MYVMCQSGPEVIAGVSVVGPAASRIPGWLSVAPATSRRFRVAGGGRTA